MRNLTNRARNGMGGFLIATLCLTACRPAAETPPAPASSEIPPPAADTRPAIVFLGDSLTAGYRLDPAEAYPTLIQQQLDAAGHAYRVINAGVSGDTTLDGLQRLDWVLRQPVAIFVLALGANDALRGQPIDHIRDTLDAILTRVREREPNVRLVLAGMRMPSNYGAAYTRAFADLYATLADQHAATLIPFLLDGVAGQPELNLSDGIHPTAAGHRMIADTVWSHLEPLL